jgi:predicted DCC family thiol-disulfide oxidoreductase YuxK
MKHERQIIFFDGVCNLCNAFVDFLVRRDAEHLFDFAPLQGSNAKQLLPARFPEKLSSVVLWSQGEVHEKSDAALMVLQQLGGLWGALRVFWVLPKGLRDWGYDLVARNRYALFGKRETCRLPTPEERARFLD